MDDNTDHVNYDRWDAYPDGAVSNSYTFGPLPPKHHVRQEHDRSANDP